MVLLSRDEVERAVVKGLGRAVGVSLLVHLHGPTPMGDNTRGRTTAQTSGFHHLVSGVRG